MTTVFALALALSLDGMFAGVAYGVRRIGIPIGSMTIVASCTMFGMGASMILGLLARDLISERTVELVGAALLGGIGVWQLFQGFLEYLRQRAEDASQAVVRWNLRDVGIVIQVLREPTLADADDSGAIDPREAVLLGAALGLDAFAAGFAAALLGIGDWVLVPIVGVAQAALIGLGIWLGRRSGRWIRGKGMLLPGAILIVLALARL